MRRASGAGIMTDPDPNAVNMALLTQLFKGAMGFQGIPVSRLPKFKGPPYAAGDLSFLEWLEEFEGIIAQYDLEDKAKARALINHLTGPAKEEIACLEESEREKFDEVVSSLNLCFGTYESLQSLSSLFHNRKQQESENLSDYSRSLKRLYTKMETSALSKEESTGQTTC